MLLGQSYGLYFDPIRKVEPYCGIRSHPSLFNHHRMFFLQILVSKGPKISILNM